MSKEQTPKPVNNIYKVPIKDISFMECLNEPPAIGHCETTTLSQGRDEIYAKFNLTNCPGFYKNWKNLTPEQKQRIQPFILDNDKEVEKVLHCERRFQNTRGDYTCGVPMRDGQFPDPNALNGEFGGCCIMGCADVPDFPDCPYRTEVFS